ncbi:MAG: hypothetical protein RL204_463 [Bacteroidota bacterium]|jgi:RHS repeat-associated protein
MKFPPPIPSCSNENISFHVGDYSFGFNGKEWESRCLDYGMRMYEPHIGRFISVDPLVNYFSFYSPYQFAGNTTISCTDLDGCEPDLKIQAWPLFAMDVKIGSQTKIYFVDGYYVMESVVSHLGVEHYLYAYWNTDVRERFWKKFVPEGINGTEGLSWDINNTDFFSFPENPNALISATAYSTYFNGYKIGFLSQGSDDGAMTGGSLGGREGWNNGGKQLFFGTIGAILSGGVLAEMSLGGIAASNYLSCGIEIGSLCLSIDDISMAFIGDGKKSTLLSKCGLSTQSVEKLKTCYDVMSFLKGLQGELDLVLLNFEQQSKTGVVSTEQMEIWSAAQIAKDQVQILMSLFEDEE